MATNIANSSGPSVDDMDDGKVIEELKNSTTAGAHELASVLEKFAENLRGQFTAADESAKRQQRCYKRWSWVSVIAGVLAVLLAIYQLSRFEIAWMPALALPIVELLLVLITIASVIWVLHKQYQHGWLNERSKAERLRSLKYQTLLDPAFWCKPDERWPSLRRQVSEIEATSTGQLECLLDEPVQPPAVPSGAQLSSEQTLRKAVFDYYSERRLKVQADFCSYKAKELHGSDLRTKLAGPILFFLVLVFVFAHAVVDVVDHGRHHPPAVSSSADGKQGGTKAEQGNPPAKDPISGGASSYLIFLAAALPVLGAGLHTYRSGREFGRNMWRFKATSLSLRRAQEQLETAKDDAERLQAMAQAEYVLAMEHQQWLQLMIECEWFG